jgi:hypothetical protein
VTKGRQEGATERGKATSTHWSSDAVLCVASGGTMLIARGLGAIGGVRGWGVAHTVRDSAGPPPRRPCQVARGRGTHSC